ncbi:MAG: hypothetical protein IJV41_06715 [Oscillospiraceae bacterium]|nr:hypothetical protein [Oscillospiraceae bacterium]
MSFFRSLLQKLKKQHPSAPVTRSAPEGLAEKANELRHNARTGDPRLGSHRSGKIGEE